MTPVLALPAGYAAQSLLAALGSVQFVSNVFFASFVLKEQVSHRAHMLCIIGTASHQYRALCKQSRSSIFERGIGQQKRPLGVCSGVLCRLLSTWLWRLRASLGGVSC